MNVKKITLEYLEKNGFDGLCNPDIECGCFKEDLMPCGWAGIEQCQPGYKGVIPPDLDEYGAVHGVFLVRTTNTNTEEGQ